jgi:hypothetical protein
MCAMNSTFVYACAIPYIFLSNGVKLSGEMTIVPLWIPPIFFLLFLFSFLFCLPFQQGSSARVVPPWSTVRPRPGSLMGGARAARGAGDGAAGEGARWWGRAQAVRGGARSDLRSPPLEHPGEHRESLSTAAPGEGLHSSLEPVDG